MGVAGNSRPPATTFIRAHRHKASDEQPRAVLSAHPAEVGAHLAPLHHTGRAVLGEEAEAVVPPADKEGRVCA